MNYFTGGYKGYLNIALKDGVAQQLGAAMVQQIMAANPGMSLEQATQAAQAQSGPLLQKLITCCNRKHRRKVTWCIHTIRIRCHKIRRCIWKLTRMRIILNIHISFEFILRRQIQFAKFSIYTNNRRQPPTCLVTIRTFASKT